MRQKTVALWASVVAPLLASTMGLGQEASSAVPPEPLIPPRSWGQELNLDFETEPPQWQLDGQGCEVRFVDDEKHTGRQSLRVRCEQAGGYGIARLRLPVAAVSEGRDEYLEKALEIIRR